MILAIDVGNTVITVGLFDEEGKLHLRSSLATARRMTRDQCAVSLDAVFRLYGAMPSAVKGGIVSSVVPPLTASVCGAVELLTGCCPMLIGPGVKTGLNIRADTHAQVGANIVAYSVGALEKYPGPVIVADMGTAITLSYLRESVYEGCVIMPGIELSLEALSDRAAELPHISIRPPAAVLGHNTVEAMRSGAVYGAAGMIDGVIDRMEEEAGPAVTLVGTGSAAPEILRFCRHTIVYDADLLLHGLYLIERKNTVEKRRKG